MRQKDTYRDFSASQVPAGDARMDVTKTYSASVGYRVGQDARVGFGAVYRQRESNNAERRDYQGFRFLTTLDYGM